MNKSLICISSLLLGFSCSVFFSGCCGKNRTTDQSIRTGHEQGTKNAAGKPSIDFTRMPLYFIANKGQVNEKAKYYAKASRYTLWLTREGLVFDQASLPKKERADGAEAEGANPRRDVSSLMFVDANPEPNMMAVAETGHRVNYFIGNDPAKWHSDIPTAQAVLYKDLYQGIDLKVYGVEKQIEYDWIVKPGANPEAITFAYQGVKGTRIDDGGNLLIETEGGELIHNRPLTYQDIDGKRVSVQAEYRKTGENTYGFLVCEYDSNHPLIIDPVVLLYSTYLGGGGTDYGYDIAADKSGNVYVTGWTWSTDFPTRNQYQSDQPDWDVFVTKIDTTQSGANSLVYSTYLGSAGAEFTSGIAADSSGNVYVTGYTTTKHFPTKNSFQTDQGGLDAFVTRIDTTRSGAASLIYSTYMGGANEDYGLDITAVDSGIVYVTGSTSSTDFPTRNPYQTDQPSDDAFITKIDTNQSGAASLVYSTYLGGGENDWGYGIAADNSGNFYVTGVSDSSDFPLKNEYQTHQGAVGGSDVFVTKINTIQSGATSLIYSTYLGGEDIDTGWDIAADNRGNVYVTGETRSTDFPTRSQYQAYQGVVGMADAFVIKINTTQSGDASLIYSTCLGGGDWDQGYGITADNSGNLYVTGETRSTDFPTKDSYLSYQGFSDAFISRIDTTQSGYFSLIYSTYLGGGSYDYAFGIAADDIGDVYVTGSTSSTDFLTKNQYQIYQANFDVFVTKFIFSEPAPEQSLPWLMLLLGD